GQFCTNPGIAIVPDGADAERFVAAAKAALAKLEPQTMLTPGIAAAYREGVKKMQARNAVAPLLSAESAGRSAGPNLFETTGAAWLSDHGLGEEVFGPLGLVVRAASTEEMLTLAGSLAGQLTA